MDRAMASTNYRISYATGPKLSFSAKTALERHIDTEEEIWKPFLGIIGSINNRPIQSNGSGNLSMETLSKAFEIMRQTLEDERKFNQLTERPPSTLVPPPPSDTLEGQLILGLLANKRQSDAEAVYYWFVTANIRAGQQQNRTTRDMVERGFALWTAAVASSALPFNQVSSQKIAGAARKAESHIEALNTEVTKADEINADHKAELSVIRSKLTNTARRVLGIVAKRERMRRQRHTEWMADIDAQVAQRFEDAETRLKAVDRTAKKQGVERQAEFERLQDLFETQLRLRAPVKLWEGRETDHKTAAKTAFTGFALSTLTAIGIGVLVPYCAGDYIADSFFTNICDNADPPACERVFSAKGPLTITGLLLVLSLVMWVTRLQYRVFLSERHLSLDASEKKAFAETYLAMKEGEDVGADNEAIVLAALFRPTQDGIIKDDESGVDLSAAAILAKQLGRNT